MWPFVTASVLTWFLVGKMQDLGVKCEFSSPPHCTSQPMTRRPAAEGYRNDPRNPYAAQIAKEAHH